MGSSKINSVFHHFESMNWVPGIPGDLMVKSKLPPLSGSEALRQNPIRKKELQSSTFLNIQSKHEQCVVFLERKWINVFLHSSFLLSFLKENESMFSCTPHFCYLSWKKMDQCFPALLIFVIFSLTKLRI